jgi:hypothetical protein
VDDVIDVGHVDERAANGAPDVACIAVVQLAERAEVSGSDVPQ